MNKKYRNSLKAYAANWELARLLYSEPTRLTEYIQEWKMRGSYASNWFDAHLIQQKSIISANMLKTRTPLLTQSFELLSGSIGWGAGLQSSRLVQSKSSNPLKVL